MVSLLGDFNALIGRNRDRWYPSLGKSGGENINERNRCNFLSLTI